MRVERRKKKKLPAAPGPPLAYQVLTLASHRAPQTASLRGTWCGFSAASWVLSRCRWAGSSRSPLPTGLEHAHPERGLRSRSCGGVLARLPRLVLCARVLIACGVCRLKISPPRPKPTPTRGPPYPVAHCTSEVTHLPVVQKLALSCWWIWKN